MVAIDKQITIKTRLDLVIKWVLLFITLICASSLIVIVVFILKQGIKPFIKDYELSPGIYGKASLPKFLIGLEWFISPKTYHVGFIVLNTIYITFLSTLIAVPISVLSALFIVKIAPKYLGMALTYVIELLAAVPSIIFGVFGKGIITKLVKNIADVFGRQTAGGISVLSTVLVLVMMIMPTITLISVTAIKSVPSNIEKASLALGASKTQTNFKVVLKSAKSGIFSGIILGVGRALGEATAVSLVCGNSASGVSLDVFDTTSTLTSTMMLGLNETQGIDYDIRFSVGVVLIVLILVTNLLLNLVKRKIVK